MSRRRRTGIETLAWFVCTCLVLGQAASAAAADGPQASLRAALEGRHPGLDVAWPPGSTDLPGEAAGRTSPDYAVSRFTYQSHGDGPFGTGLAVWKRDGGRLVWSVLLQGDRRPHSILWIDVDGDGDDDLYYLVDRPSDDRHMETHVYLAAMDPDAAGNEAPFSQGLECRYSYCALIDPDGDGIPEIIDDRREEARTSDAALCRGLRVPQDLREEMSAEFVRVAGAFADLAPDHGLPGFEALFNLALVEPVTILRLRDGRRVDVTRELPDHLRWRIGMLERLRALSGEDCSERIDERLEHLRKRLD